MRDMKLGKSKPTKNVGTVAKQIKAKNQPGW
jgi:hypothetical protein